MADKPTVASSASSFGSELQKYYPKSSSERENFVFNSILRYVNKGQLESNMKPITVTGPNQEKITFKVMPDYVMIGSTRVPMSGNTAKRVAANFGLKLPDAKIAELVYQNADVQVAAKPLSGTGAIVNGVEYTGQDVVNKGVDQAGFVVSYNDNINKELKKRKTKSNQIVSGFAKDIVDLPGNSSNLGLYGMHDAKGNPIGAATPTGGTSHDLNIHSEYGAFLRLVSDEVEVTDPKTGKVSKIPASQLSSLLADGKVKANPPANQEKPVNIAVPTVSSKKKIDVSQPQSERTDTSTSSGTSSDDISSIKNFLESINQKNHNIVKNASDEILEKIINRRSKIKNRIKLLKIIIKP